MVEHDAITDRRVLRVAREHKLTVAAVREALDNHPMNTGHDVFLRRTLAMELVELDELQAAFRESQLGLDYQLRLQIYFALKFGLSYTIETTRELSPALVNFLLQWGGTVYWGGTSPPR